MADKIRGITIELNGDASGLTKSLKSVNSEVSNTQKQLKDVEKLLKLDPKNTELLRQKHELLGKQVENTKAKLDQLHKVEQSLKDAGVDKNSDQFMAVRREIVSTETEAKRLKDAYEESNVALVKMQGALDTVSSKAGKVADATRGISGAAGAALGGIVGAGIAAAAESDDLNTLAKQTGLTTATLQKAKYASDLIDVSYETFTGSITKMVSKLRTNEEGFNALGVATRNANDELLGTEEIFWNAANALSAMENETERDIAAQELFGKSAAELAGILDDGGKAFRDLGDDAERAGLIMSQDTLDSLNEVNDKLDTLKAKSAATISVSGAKALEALEPVIDKVADTVGRLLDKIGEMSPEQIERIMIALGSIALISPTAGAVEKVTGAMSGLIGLWPKISGIGEAVGTAAVAAGKAVGTAAVAAGKAVASLFSKIFAFIAANPISLIIAAIIALVALIATKGDEIQAILQKVDDFLQGIFARDWTEVFGPVLGEALNGFFANIKNIWDAIKQILDGVIDFIRGVFTGDWKRAWEGIKEIFGGIFKGLGAIVKAPLNGIITMLNGIISGINFVIRGLNKLPNVNIGEVGKIPYLAKGGILSRGSAIVGEAGPEMLTVSGGRAIVQPLTNNTTTNHNLGGLTLNVYGAPGQDVNDLADRVMDLIQQATEQRGAVFA